MSKMIWDRDWGMWVTALEASDFSIRMAGDLSRDESPAAAVPVQGLGQAPKAVEHRKRFHVEREQTPNGIKLPRGRRKDSAGQSTLGLRFDGGSGRGVEA